MPSTQAPGGFVRPLSVRRAAVQGGSVRALQSGDFTANATTLVASDLGGTLQVAAGAVTAAGTITLPTVSELRAASIRSGDTFHFHVQNNSSFPVTLAGGTGMTMIGDPGLAVNYGGGLARVKVLMNSTTAADVWVTHLAQGATFSPALTAATTLTSADSGVAFTLPATGATPINLPTPAPGLKFTFVLVAAATGDEVITAPGAFLEGLLSINSVDTQVTGRTTVTFATGAALAGDYLIVEGISATQYRVSGATSAAGGFTLA